METTETTNVTFKVEQNKKYGVFRVVKYINGFWLNERCGNWSKNKAEQKAKQYRELAKRTTTMADNI
jgi:hypothetical protein